MDTQVGRTAPWIGLLLLVVVGCAMTEESGKDPGSGSGFGISYDQMYTTSGDMIVWSRAEARETLYEEILLDPLVPRLSDETVRRVGATREAAGAVRTVFRATWESIIGVKYPTVNVPTGPAIQVSPSFVDQITIAELAGLRAALTSDPDGRLPKVCLQLLFTDAASGQLLAAAISQKDAYLHELALRGELDDDGLHRAVRPIIERVRVALDSPVRRD